MNWVFFAINCYFSHVFWVWSKEHFENSRNGIGWLLLVASATNFASAMSML
jgi:hypothetical protein